MKTQFPFPKDIITTATPTGYTNCIEIDAPSREEARTKMFDHYGKRWAFLYDESERAEAIDAFNTPIINRI